MRARVLITRGPQAMVADRAFLSSTGIIVPADDGNWPPGAIVDVDFTLQDEAHAFTGEAKAIRRIPAANGGPAGIEFEFLKLDHDKKTLFEQLQDLNRVRRVATRSVFDIAHYLRHQARGNRVPGRDFGEPGSGHRPPVLVIHGFLGTRGAMFLLEQRLKSIGFPVFSIPLGMLNVDDIAASARVIAERIEALAAKYGFDRINILGHSMGGLIALYYIKRLGGDRRVRRLVSIGTPYRGASMALGALVAAPWLALFMKSITQIVPGSSFLEELHAGPLPKDVEFVSLIARNDQVVDPHSCVLRGAHNIVLATNHAGLVVAPKTFAAIDRVLRGEWAPPVQNVA
ncbi:alpha/beta fold hydrolase [bacterium]|nr:alpha/beta fold hydrolase [bacterium]